MIRHSSVAEYYAGIPFSWENKKSTAALIEQTWRHTNVSYYSCMMCMMAILIFGSWIDMVHNYCYEQAPAPPAGERRFCHGFLTTYTTDNDVMNDRSNVFIVNIFIVFFSISTRTVARGLPRTLRGWRSRTPSCLLLRLWEPRCPSPPAGIIIAISRNNISHANALFVLEKIRVE